MGALLVGVFVGLIAIIFTEGVHAVRSAFMSLIDLEGGKIEAGSLIAFTLLLAFGCVLATMIGLRLLGEAAAGGMNVSIARYHDGKPIPSGKLWYKLVQASVALGSGSAGGGEGPIGYMGGAAGSIVQKLMNLPPQSSRALIAAGMGAGIASLFKAPMAGAIFAAEVIYGSLGIEARVLFVSVPACVAAFCVYGSFYGYEAVLPVTAQPFNHPSELVGYGLIGLACALAGRIFYEAIHAVHRLAGDGLRRVAASLTGGLLVGGTVSVLLYTGTRPEQALALLGDGYTLFRAGALDPQLGDAILLLAAAIGLRIVFSSAGIGTATGIGDFAPSVTLGGLTGALVSHIVHTVYPPFAPPVAASAVVGMAAFYGSMSRAPLAGVLLVSEITGRYTLMIPALWSTLIAFRSIGSLTLYDAQRERPDPADDLWRRPSGEDIPVSALLEPSAPEIPHLRAEEPATRLLLLGVDIGAVATGNGQDNGEAAFLFANDIENHRQRDVDVHLMPALDLARRDIQPLSEDDALSSALSVMLHNGLNALPVRRQDGTLCALSRNDLLRHLKVETRG